MNYYNQEQAMIEGLLGYFCIIILNHQSSFMVTLKTAVYADYKSLARLHAQNWRDTYRGILSDFFLDNKLEQYMTDTWQKKLRSPTAKQITTIALSEDKIAGFSCLVLDDDETYGSMLDNLHIAHDQQNKGIGKMLIQHCAGIICDLAADHRMWLWVYAQNQHAIAVYKRLGGSHTQTVEKETAEGTRALVYRYTWADVCKLR